MKYAWIDGQRPAFDLSELCAVLDVSISGYRAWKRGGTPDRKRLSDTQMLTLIQAIHAELKGAYGSPRMVLELRARGFSAGKERVERLMREHGIHARHKRRYKVTTDSKHGLPVAENRLERNFTPAAPNQVWTSDITYLWTDEGWLYLAIVLDLFNREVVGEKAGAGAAAPLRPGRPVRECSVPEEACRLWHGLFDEPQGQLLGQRSDRELVQQLQERAGAWRALRNTGGDDRGQLRVHRGVLQPRTPPFDPRLPVAGTVLEELDPRSTEGKTRSMKPTRWKTKNRGNLTITPHRNQTACSASSRRVTASRRPAASSMANKVFKVGLPLGERAR